MKRVLLIHQDKIQHYRVSIYNYLSSFLRRRGFYLTVASDGVQQGSPHHIAFHFTSIRLNVINLVKIIKQIEPDIIIFFVNLKNPYLFPVLLFAKMRKIKCIYWGHGVDLEQPKSIKNVFYKLEHRIVDALILYAEFLKRYVGTEYHYKVFVANNTLNTVNYKRSRNGRKAVLPSYNITTKKNIVCMGRMQRRKRIGDLIEAFKLMGRADVGLILIGPDTDGILQNIEGRNIHVLSQMYGVKAISLLSACDVYCLPGAVGLSIVDAFFCGLPIVTENVRHGPEICYFKDGVNGFMVEKGDVLDLGQKVELLLDDDNLRKRFSEAAINEIETVGHIDNMCKGFLDALEFVTDWEKTLPCYSTNGRIGH